LVTLFEDYAARRQRGERFGDFLVKSGIVVDTGRAGDDG